MFLQRILFPKDLDSFLPSLFYHTTDNCSFYARDDFGKVELGDVKRISFDTWFNMFSLAKWRRYCKLENIFFRLKSTGSVTLRLYKIQRDCCAKLILEERVSGEVSIRVPVEGINYSYIFVELVNASANFSLYEETGFYTDEIPFNKVSMVAVITHFNRKDSLLPHLRSLSEEIENEPLLKKSLKVVVVDNSNNIAYEEVKNLKNIHILPNQNYGGSGGYAKGLLYAKSIGATHCIFTDDDVRCEIESIRRTFAIFSLTKEKDLAIAGAILSEENPKIAIQAGAKFTSRGWIGQSVSFELDTTYGAIFQDSQLAHPDYGAWPFFAFPVSSVKKFPFPFFVRGDDVLFGIDNKFFLCTLNGIGVSVGNIIWREGPSTLYQDVRAILVINLKKGTNSSEVVNYLKELILALLRSYKYSSARAVLLAIQDVMQGPEYFRNNLTNQEARSKLAPLAKKELFKLAVNVSPDTYPDNILGLTARIKRKLEICLVSAFPSLIRINKAIYQDKCLFADFSKTYKYKKIFYYCGYNNTFLVLEFSSKETSEIKKLSKSLIKNFKNSYLTLMEKYQSSTVGSESDWIKIYKEIRTL